MGNGLRIELQNDSNFDLVLDSINTKVGHQQSSFKVGDTLASGEKWHLNWHQSDSKKKSHAIIKFNPSFFGNIVPGIVTVNAFCDGSKNYFKVSSEAHIFSTNNLHYNSKGGPLEASTDLVSAVPLPSPVLRVLNYNTHLAHGGTSTESGLISAIVAVLEKYLSFPETILTEIVKLVLDQIDIPDLMEERDEARRRDAIVHRILDMPDGEQPDVICLHEVWGDDFRSNIIDQCRPTYAYSFAPPRFDSRSKSEIIQDVKQYLKGPEWVWAFLEQTLSKQDLVSLLGGNGLLILSKYPINLLLMQDDQRSLRNSGFFSFNYRPKSTIFKWKEDVLASKGIASFAVHNGHNRVICLTTHAPTPGANPSVRIQRILAADSGLHEVLNFPDKHGLFFCGDLNISRFEDLDNASSYQDLLDQVVENRHLFDHEFQMSDLFEDWDLEEAYTVSPEANPFPDPKQKKKVLDYHFSNLPLSNETRRWILRDWTYQPSDGDHELSLSDHYPVLTEIAMPEDPEPETEV